jgi:intracellular septation protein
MKFLVDLFPVILFFAMFTWGGRNSEAAQSLATKFFSGVVSGHVVNASLAPILLATAITILATLIQIVYLFARRKNIGVMLWVSLGIITVLGGATIYFQNADFIKWKPTILYWFCAAALVVSNAIFKKNLIRKAMGEIIVLPDKIWANLNLAWIAFFTVMGVVNLYVGFNFSFETWVTFKAFGLPILMFVYAAGQIALFSKHLKDPE